MKKLLLLVAFISLIGIGYIDAQCTITPYYVHPDSLAAGSMRPKVFRFCEGDLIENQSVQVLPMTKYNYLGDNFDVDSFKLTNLAPKPGWLDDPICKDPQCMFRAGVWTCISLSSTAPVPIGIVPAGKDSVVFKIGLQVSAWARLSGTTVVQSASPEDSITLVVYRKVGGVCLPVYWGIKEQTNNFNVIQSTPNPFVSETTIGFNTNQAGEFELRVYNTLGQVVFTEKLNAVNGNNNFTFTGSDLNKGMYVYTVNGQAFKLVKN